MQKEIANFRQEYVDKVLEDGNSGKSFYLPLQPPVSRGENHKQPH